MTQQRILIIDDDADIVKTVSANLELDGFEVSSAPNGNEGLAALQSRSPDLVLLDLNLPDIDGIKVCQILLLPNQWIFGGQQRRELVQGLLMHQRQHLVCGFDACVTVG